MATHGPNHDIDEAAQVLRRVDLIRVRDDVDFLDAEHIGPGVVLAHDIAQWKYTAIGQMDYIILEALDEGSSLADVFGYLYGNYSVQVDIDRIKQTVEFALEARLFDLWCYPKKLKISRWGIREFRERVAALQESNRSPDLAPFYSALEDAISSHDAVSIAKVLRAVKGTAAHAMYAGLYDGLIQCSLPRARIELNFLKSRLDLFDPTTLLRILSPVLGWIHHPLGAVACLLVAGIFALTTPYDSYSDLLNPRSNATLSLFAVENIVIFQITNWVNVFKHELLGHCLALAFYGGRAPTVGILVFIGILPAGFANVTDTYRQPSRWKRVWVDAAGIYVDVLTFLLSVGMFRYVEPGSNGWVACAVSIVANGMSIGMNSVPWLKLDGYYILSDASGQPSLQEDALAIGAKIRDWLLDGKEIDLEGFSKQQIRWGVAFFVLQSSWIMMMLPMFIMMVVPRITLVLGPLGFILAIVGIAFRLKIMLMPSRNSDSEVTKKDWTIWVHFPRVLFPVMLSILVLYIPFGFSWHRDAQLEPIRVQSVDAPVRGRVEWTAGLGEAVKGSDVLVRLSNKELEWKLAKAESKVNELMQQYELAFSRHHDLSSARTKKAAAEGRLELLRQDVLGLRKLGLASDLSAAERRLLGEQSALNSVIQEADSRLEGPDEFELARLEGDIEAARAHRDTLAKQVEALTIRAQFGGTITKVYAAEGDLVDVGSALAMVSDLSQLQVVAELPPSTQVGLLELKGGVGVLLPTGHKLTLPPREIHQSSTGTRVALGPLYTDELASATLGNTSVRALFKQRPRTPFRMIVDGVMGLTDLGKSLF